MSVPLQMAASPAGAKPGPKPELPSGDPALEAPNKWAAFWDEVYARPRREHIEIPPSTCGLAITAYLGSGSFAHVLAVEDERKVKYALKVPIPAVRKGEAITGVTVVNECGVLFDADLDRTNIVRGVRLLVSSDFPEGVAILMELFPTNMHSFIRDTPDAKLAILIRMVAGAASGVASLHARGMLHLDLSPPNVLFDPTSQATKLCDFGASVHVDPLTKSWDSGGVGSYITHWMRPPEHFVGHPQSWERSVFTFGSEVWCLGLLLLCAVTRSVDVGQPPNELDVPQWHAVQFADNAVRVAWLARLVERHVPREHRDTFLNLLVRTLTYEAKDRISLADFRTHGVFDLLPGHETKAVPSSPAPTPLTSSTPSSTATMSTPAPDPAPASAPVPTPSTTTEAPSSSAPTAPTAPPAAALLLPRAAVGGKAYTRCADVAHMLRCADLRLTTGHNTTWIKLRAADLLHRTRHMLMAREHPARFVAAALFVACKVVDCDRNFAPGSWGRSAALTLRPQSDEAVSNSDVREMEIAILRELGGRVRKSGPLDAIRTARDIRAGSSFVVPFQEIYLGMDAAGTRRWLDGLASGAPTESP